MRHCYLDACYARPISHTVVEVARIILHNHYCYCYCYKSTISATTTTTMPAILPTTTTTIFKTIINITIVNQISPFELCWHGKVIAIMDVLADMFDEPQLHLMRVSAHLTTPTFTVLGKNVNGFILVSLREFMAATITMMTIMIRETIINDVRSIIHLTLDY